MTRYRISSNGRSLEFEHECLVGRGADCDFLLRPEEFASRRHARLTVCASGVVVEDLSSHNGVWLDGARLVGPRLVVGAHVLRLGKARVILEPVERAGEGRRVLAEDKETAPEPFAAVPAVVRATS